MQVEIKKKRRKRRWRAGPDGEVPLGLYIVPNLFTTANLFSGFVGIVNAVDGNYRWAALAIIASCVFDILDGKVARLTRATSKFGVEYDSLADLVAFGVAPGLLMYLWALRPFGRLGWLAAFLFVACGALRLARFNVMASTGSKKHFMGLPIPGGAIVVATTVLFLIHEQVEPSTSVDTALLIVTYLTGFLMISTIPYNSFKDFEMMKAKPLPVLFVVLLIVTVVAISPERMLFALMVLYVVSGPVGYIWTRLRGKAPQEAPAPAACPPCELPTEGQVASGEEKPPTV